MDDTTQAAVLVIWQKYYDKDWRNNTRGFVLHSHRQLTNRFASGDLHWLKRKVRYDQHIMLELCELITGRKFKGLSNKKLALLLEELCSPKEDADV